MGFSPLCVLVQGRGLGSLVLGSPWEVEGWIGVDQTHPLPAFLHFLVCVCVCSPTVLTTDFSRPCTLQPSEGIFGWLPSSSSALRCCLVLYCTVLLCSVL
jgi:hypothetical protein